MKQLDNQYKFGWQLYCQLDSQVTGQLSSDLGMLRQYLKHQLFETLEEALSFYDQIYLQLKEGLE